MSLRLAFDLDGVFADLDLALRQIATDLFGPRVFAPVEAAAVLDAAGSHIGLAPHEWEKVWRRVGEIEGFWEGLREIEPGSIKRLAATARTLRWEVIFLTQRPATAGEVAQVQSQRWLERHGYPLPSVFVVPGSRAKVASALQLDLVVDDAHEQCLDIVAESKARALLIWRGGVSTVPHAARRLGIGVVDSVGSCLDILEEIDSIVTAPPTVMDRLQRKLGL